jgi:hypothetical protein
MIPGRSVEFSAELPLKDMAAVSLTPVSEDTKELVRLCRAGRLYDVERWIAAGKPLETLTAKKKNLLQVEVETGFHSLVDLRS